MKLYHGGLQPITAPKIIRSELGRDFGFAFYTTTLKSQAERWALRRWQSAYRNGNKNAHAVVSVFEFADVSAQTNLTWQNYSDASLDWLELVIACRSNLTYFSGYDIISGKIADDNVGETIAYVLAGVMRKDDAIKRLKFQKINNQIAFCTEQSLSYLTFESSYIVKELHQ